MPTISDYLGDLVIQKRKLADNLITKGVSASYDEKFNTLIPKILNIKGGEDTLPQLYPVYIELNKNILTIKDTSNGLFGEGYVIYGNGVSVSKFENSGDWIEKDLDITFLNKPIGDYNINVTVYDDPEFKTSAISNTVLYRMPGWRNINWTANLQVDYEETSTPWKPAGNTIKLI